MKTLYTLIVAALYAVADKAHSALFGYMANRGLILGANTLTNLIPDAFQAMDTVAREMVGFIPAVSLDSGAERAAVGQAVRTHVAPAAAASNVTPGTTPPDDGDQVIGSRTITITKARVVPFRWTGEEQRGVNFGTGYRNIRADQIAQAIRTLVNEMESDVGALAYKASRAYGSQGVTPFASTLADPAQVRKILVDNGAPTSDLQLVIDTSAGAAMRTLAQLSKANESADTTLLRQGILLPLHGMDVRESAGVANPVTGTAAATASVNAAGYAIGATVLTLTAAGSGTILDGDVVTFAGDTNKYVVLSGDSDVSNGGTITIAAPGLRVAMVGSKQITMVTKSARNLAFHRSAIVLAARAPALPEEGDSASDRMVLTDPRSGMSFEFAMYPQYRRIRYEVSAAWGTDTVKNEFMAVLLGQA